LNPEQTVNTATGEMGFSLPLGTVKGINGKEIGVNLNYKSGIKVNQEASAAGLGFSFGAGSISRKVVYVPDDNIGGPGNALYKIPYPDYEDPWWKTYGPLIKFGTTAIISVISIWCPPASVLTGFVGALYTGVSFAVTMITLYQDVYFAGGTHLSGYDPPENVEIEARGYFREDENHYDKPDIYFVNTPFVTGELVWCSGYNPIINKNGMGGYFVFKNTKGGAKKGEITNIVDYDLDKEVFTITLENGMKLLFEDTVCTNSLSNVFWQQDVGGGTVARSINTYKQIQRVPVQWLLTKVLYPDFVDYDTNDNDPTTNSDLAKGSWIVYKYKRTPKINARPLPVSSIGGFSQTIISTQGCDPVDENASIFVDVQLERIITPNQSAECFYSSSRLDNLWFKSDYMEWHEFERGDIPAKLVKLKPEKVGAGDPYIKKLRLDSILFYSQSYDTLKRVRFNHDYSLKHGSFHSYSKDEYGNFITIPGNDNAGCLTLKRIEITDKNNSITHNVYFKYNETDLIVWDSTKTGVPSGPSPKAIFYSEKKDYWGYCFYVDTDRDINIKCGDYNKLGINFKPEQRSFWSLNEIEFSNGLKIEWEYEPHRYDMANNIPVNGPNGTNRKFGGGIRVKNMIINNGIDTVAKRSFFYTNSEGCFVETDENSSGHATVEPYPYISIAGTDNREEKARGGFYTSCQVMYEMVQVVDNYNYSAEYPAPNGYSVYEYITPHCHSTDEIFVNEGKYGEVDNSWKRGHLKKKSIFNKNNKIIASQKYNYEFIEQHKKSDYKVLTILDSLYSYLYEHRCGWVKLKSVETYSDGVNKTIEHKYADEVNNVNKPDYQYFSRKEFEIFDAGDGMNPWGDDNMASDHQVYTCRVKRLKGTDQTDSSYDYIVVRSISTSIAFVCIGSNLGPGMSDDAWTDYEQDPLYGEGVDKSLVGIALYKMPDGDDYEDLIIVSSPPGYLSTYPYLYVTVLHNIGLDSINNKVVWDTDLTTRTQIFLDKNDLKYLDTLDSSNDIPGGSRYNYPRGCVISNYNQDVGNKPDILILTNIDNIHYFRGDICRNGMDSPYGRNIFALMDFVEPPPGADYTINGDMKIWRRGADKPYYFYGNTGFFKANDDDGVVNDLILVGPGAVTSESSTLNISRHVAYQIFKNINLEDYGYVKFDEPCENCNEKSNGTLFNANPGGGEENDGWNYTRHIAYFEESEDKQTFVFFQQRKETYVNCHFYLLDYLPVYYEGDYDGMPNRTVQKTSSNQPIMLTNSIPAYFHYNGMVSDSDSGDYHILNNECGSIQYHFPHGTADSVFTDDLSIYSDRVVSSIATTWDKINGVFVPQANYIWNVTMNSSGLPDTNYTPFDYTNGASNPYWLLTDSITEYTEHSQLKESVKPLNSSYNVYSAVNYGHNDKLPVASLKNAKFKESGVLTCDYNDNDENFYIDKNNGWELGNVCPGDSLPPTVELEKSIKHFGNASMHVVNAFGPSRNFKLTKYCDYIMSAWVNVISDTVYMTGDFRYIEKTQDTIWPVHPSALNTVMGVSFNGIKQGPTGGKWVLLKLKIPADSLLGSKNFEDNNWYARMFVGPYKGGEVYIDDIRFYPEKAMVTSSYYDSLWHQPILSIDENNKPGLRISYGGFGRPILWEKINPQFSVGETGFAVTVKEKDYFTKYDGICIISPKEGDYYAVSNPLEIKWRNDNERDVEIFYSIATDSPWVSLGIVNAVSDKKEYSYIWNVPVSQEQSEQYRIKIVDIAEQNVYDQTMIFSIAKGKVFYPEKGSRLLAGMCEEIKYFIMGDTSVDIIITVNGLPIDTVKNTGIYLWSIPGDIQPNSNHIISIEGNGITAESEKFTIINNQFIRKYQCDLMRPQWK